MIRSEEDEGVVVDFKLCQEIDDLADLRVDFRDHRRIDFLVVRPVFIFEHADGWNLVSTVGQRPGDVEVEGAVFAISNEVEGKVEDEVVHVGAGVLSFVIRIYDTLFVAPKVIGIISMGVSLVEVAEPLVESLAVRDAGGVRLTQAPFAGHPGMITGALQKLGDGEVFGLQRDTFLISHAADDAEVVADPTVTAVQTGVENATGRRADRGAGVALGKARSALGESIEVRCRDDGSPVAPEVLVAEVIAENEDDVGFGHGNFYE